MEPEKSWRGRGRATPLVARVSRSPSLSSPSSSSSGPSVGPVTELFGTMRTTEAKPSSDDAGPRTRGRSPATQGTGQPRRGFLRSGDYIATRPKTLATKKGTLGNPIPLLVNFFVLKKATAWSLYHYDVAFDPLIDLKKLKKVYLRQHAATMNTQYLFDGGKSLYTSQPLPADPFVVVAQDQKDPSQKCKITMTLVGKLEPGDNVYIQFYNILLRKCLQGMKLEEMGRNYFDTHAAIDIPEYRLRLLPGFVTSIRNHEHDVLLCVETTHKVIRMDSVLSVLQDVKNKGGDYKKNASDEIIGTIVLTHYNDKTYSVSDIEWSKSPKSTFDMKGKDVSYAEYYKMKYDLTITDLDQPLLHAKPKKQDYHRGQQQEQPPCYLIPELCKMTGLTDGMRSNFQLMKELSKYLHQGPQGRINAINKFMSRLQSVPEITDDMKKWGLEFSKEVSKCGGRTLPAESIIFASPRGEAPEKLNEKADWTMAFRSRKLLSAPKLTTWSIIVPQRDAQNVDNLVQTMRKVSTPLGFNLPPPATIHKIPNPQANSYMRAIDELTRSKTNEMLFVILPANKPEPYGSIKKKLSGEIGLISQCFVAKNMTSKGLMSIATKVVIQITAKLGGEPWSIHVPLKKMMVVGFDVYHATKSTGGRNVAAMVASYTPSHASFYSAVSFYSGSDELSRCVCSDLIKCIQAYREMNNELPERILMYRDGVGDGQLEMVFRTELVQIHKALDEIYGTYKQATPKLTFVVVSKKINTRLFSIAKRDAENPPPGTVCDDVVTLPERYDFFLVPQVARQGTVSPTAFNILYDTQNLDPDKIQRLTFKFCHLYFNWSGTVGVPAPCQYAHKLAALTGMSIGLEPNMNLNYKLHFL